MPSNTIAGRPTIDDPIDPIYDIQGTNDIDLGTHTVSFWSNGKRTADDVSFTMAFGATLRLVGKLRNAPFIYLDKNTDIEIPSLLGRFRPVAYGTCIELSPRSEPVDICYCSVPKMREIVFHLVNFYDFTEGRLDLLVRNNRYRGRFSRITLQGGGWDIVVHPLPSTRTSIEDLSTQGGYGVTHIGRIRRRLGGAFSVHQARAILEILRLFLSFARGAFTGAVLPLGFDKLRQTQWAQWGAQHIVYPWRYYGGWFHGKPASLLEDIFPGFFDLCRNPLWKERLRETIYLYLRANDTRGAGVDGGLILAQATLEKIAWIHCVESRGLYSAQHFGSRAMPARRKIAALLQDLGIPLRFPPRLRALASAARKNGWQDGPEAIVHIRNEVVHAERRYARPPFSEAWRLAQWYIELALLSLAGHSGYYVDRIAAEHTGDISKVPWA